MSEQGEKWHVVEIGDYDSYNWFLCRCTTGQHGAKFGPLSCQDAADYLNELEQLRPRAVTRDRLWVARLANKACELAGVPANTIGGGRLARSIMQAYDALPPSQGEGA